MPTFLITFKPATENEKRGWPMASLLEVARRVAKDGFAVEAWRVSNRKRANPGDRVYLLRQGKLGPAIIGEGTLLNKPTERGEHQMADVKFTKLVNPLTHALVTSEELNAIPGGAKSWRTQSSGIILDEDVAQAIATAMADAGGSTALPVLPGKPTVRLSETDLRLATADFIWQAVQDLRCNRVSHPFGESHEFDLIADDGERLAPKAVLGVALSRAMDGAPVGPQQFTGGDASLCHRLLQAAGYAIVRKGAATPPASDSEDDETSWAEGKEVLVSHRKRERAPGLARAKRAHEKRLHGRLICAKCKLDPVAHFGTEHAEACIEVHHAEVHVGAMAPGHRTTLADVVCLCANCHRLVHRLIARSPGTGAIYPMDWGLSA